MRLYYFIPILIIIVCHLTCILSLPITSQPLASNPEHLTWDAWQMPENSGRHPDHKAKKITPKSIFITPNFQTSPSHTCPPDHKLDSNKRCIQIVKINEDELLANRIQALLGQTTSQSANEATDGEGDGGDLYDYDYEEEDGENGPFQLNLPLTFEAVYPEEALPLKAGEETLLPFPAPHRPTHVDDSHTDAGTISYISVEKISNATDEETMAQSNGTTGNGTKTIGTTNNDFRDSNATRESCTTPGSNKYESSTNSAPITGQTDRTDSDYPLPSSDSEESETSTTDDDGLPSVTDLSQKTMADGVTDKIGMEFSSTETSVSASTLVTNDDNFSVTFVSNETSVLEDMNQAMKLNVSDIFGDPFSEVVTGEMEWINYGNDTDDISEDAFLESESFIVSNNRVTTQKTDTTLEVNENGHTMESSGADVDYPLPSSQTEEEHVDVNRESAVTETTPVFIVTPQSTVKQEGNLWSLLQSPTRVHHKIHGGNNVPQRTTPASPATIEDVEKILLGPTDEQSTEMKEREQAIKHEKNEAYLENLDSNNRFVYHHLTSSTTPKPSVVSIDRSNDRILNQIKEINRIVTENRLRHPNYPTKKQEPTRIRFPTDYNSHSNSDITFPQMSDFASATGTRFAPSYNSYNNNHEYSNLHFGPSTTLAPPTTSAASPTNKPPFWWLPPGWQVDHSGQKPTLLRFWERMPLVRDPSMMQRSSSRSTRRENSRSPSENLYQEISAQDIYKVLQSSNRDWKHTNS